MLNYHKTYFLNSYTKISDIKINDGIEIAFVGYSNSGKSSAINYLTNQKNIARRSKTPGRTQLINFFEVVSDFRIVDLPGYGYTYAPLVTKKKWQKMLYNYLEKRDLLKGLVLLMDIRFPLKCLDFKILEIVIKKNIPIFVLLTKCDQLKVSKQKTQLHKVHKKLNILLNYYQIEVFSSVKKIGLNALKIQLNEWYLDFLTNNKSY